MKRFQKAQPLDRDTLNSAGNQVPSVLKAGKFHQFICEGIMKLTSIRNGEEVT